MKADILDIDHHLIENTHHIQTDILRMLRKQRKRL